MATIDEFRDWCKTQGFSKTLKAFEKEIVKRGIPTQPVSKTTLSSSLEDKKKLPIPTSQTNISSEKNSSDHPTLNPSPEVVKEETCSKDELPNAKKRKKLSSVSLEASSLIELSSKPSKRASKKREADESSPGARKRLKLVEESPKSSKIQSIEKVETVKSEKENKRKSILSMDKEAQEETQNMLNNIKSDKKTKRKKISLPTKNIKEKNENLHVDTKLTAEKINLQEKDDKTNSPIKVIKSEEIPNPFKNTKPAKAKINSPVKDLKTNLLVEDVKQEKNETSFKNTEPIKEKINSPIIGVKSEEIEKKKNIGSSEKTSQALKSDSPIKPMNEQVRKTPDTIKQAKGTQPKKLNEPFRRVKAEDIELDPRLANNSFLAKGGAEGSYGHKAHQDLIVTRGKAFTKEKNKKKRGSYKGGFIDMASHSIKFD